MCADRLCAVIGILSSIGCKDANNPPNPPVDPDFDAFEAKWVADHQRWGPGATIDKKDTRASYRGVFIGRAGVIIDRKLIAKLDELEDKLDVRLSEGSSARSRSHDVPPDQFVVINASSKLRRTSSLIDVNWTPT
jgi:hypothetical protein